MPTTKHHQHTVETPTYLHCTSIHSFVYVMSDHLFKDGQTFKDSFYLHSLISMPLYLKAFLSQGLSLIYLSTKCCLTNLTAMINIPRNKK